MDSNQDLAHDVSSSSPASQSENRKGKNKLQNKLRNKQASRKFHGASAPDPSLSLSPNDEFASFTKLLESSTRVFALLGAGLSASSGLATFRGTDRFWRGMDPMDLSDAQAFYSDPVKVWWLFTHRMMLAQNAKPNAGHFALAKLAKMKKGFFAVNQNIDGKW